MSRIQWGPVLDEAREIVESYDTAVTLRQLFYRLLARQLIPNAKSPYKRLSALTADGRREGTFPELADRTRQIHEYRWFHSPGEAIRDAADTYRRDRTEGQHVSIYLGVEKNGMAKQLQSWFGDLGVPVLALGGYASQTYMNGVVAHTQSQARPAVLLYAGDHDPSGWDIERDFVERTGCWKATHRIALTPEQVTEHELPEAVDNDPLTVEKLEKDSRARAFAQRFGRLTQVELDALEPDVLRGLYAEVIGNYWDMSEFESLMPREERERLMLAELAVEDD